jgi:hypothetical protein
MPHMMLNGDKADFETKNLFDEMCRLVSRHEFPTWRVFVQRDGPSFEVTVTEQESGAHEPVFDSTRAGGDTAEEILTAFDRGRAGERGSPSGACQSRERGPGRSRWHRRFADIPRVCEDV